MRRTSSSRASLGRESGRLRSLWALTGAVLILLNAKHPPAGATTLLIALGLLTSRSQIAAVAVGVVILTVVSWTSIARLACRFPSGAARNRSPTAGALQPAP